ncbi:MAG: phosphatidate cytidylyltransferase [Thiotrichaceae bacterium]|nr:phosphatidate cytidylyltransferase [Thiotrichaceae bacterium]PCI14526.1 MAG: phosphatidate cytidylyltransferase [Thiotrichales bacterium]
MLKQRVITALILAPLFVWAVIALPTTYISILFAVMITVGAAEWVRLMGEPAPIGKYPFIGLVWLLMLVSAWMSQYTALFYLLLSASALWWCYAVWLLQRYSAHVLLCEAQGDVTQFPLAALPAIGIVLLVPTWIAMVVLHSISPYWLLLMMVLIWGADTGAYFAGRACGQRKLAPQVSPGKSWEGVAGAMAMTVAVALVGGVLLEVSGVALLGLVILSLITVAFSIVGDLMESLMKRRIGVKDSGTLLPGHGGVLDRIDSLTAAAPIFALGVSLLGVRA